MHQSPIDFPPDADIKVNSDVQIKFNYNDLKDVEITNNGNTTMVIYPSYLEFT